MVVREASLSDILRNDEYHSAIISTYTIDPVYTKKIFIPLLQSYRIRNVTVIADRRELQKVMQIEGIQSLLKSTSFLLLPANTKRLFHPKVMFFAGEDSGLCVIGSGNLTHSGMGGNREIWGAYHYSREDKKNAKIFLDVWNFLQEFNPKISGIGGEKSRSWVINHCQWLSEILSNPEEQVEGLSNIISNENDGSIWEYLRNNLEDKSLNYITLVSPFYDKNAEVIKEIKTMFPDTVVNMVYDEYGTIPKLKKPLKNVNCYSWGDVRNQSEKKDNSTKLHAKILLAEDHNGNQTILFGSSNMTKAGLGLGNLGNVELSLLAKDQNVKYDWELGLKFDDLSPKMINQISNHDDLLEEPSIKSRSNIIYVLYAEQKGDTLLIDIDEEAVGQQINLQLYDKANVCVHEEKSLTVEKNTLEVPLDRLNPVPVIDHAIIVDRDEQIKFLVYQAHKLNVDNPDPRSAKIRYALAEISKSSFGNLYDLFNELFNSLSEDVPDKEPSTGVEGREVHEEQIDGDDRYFSKSDLKERNRSHPGYYASEDFLSEGLFSIISALDDELKFDEEETADEEALASDSTVQIHVSDDQADNPEKTMIERLKDSENKRNGYQKYLRKAIKYYSITETILSKANHKQIYRFLSNWLLVNSVALHAIKTDLNKAPIQGENGLIDKTSIPPYDYDKAIGIDEICVRLITSVIGRLSLSKFNISADEYLDSEKRLIGAVKMIELLHLRHWHDGDIFIAACNSVIQFFQFDNSEVFPRLRSKLQMESEIYHSKARLNDWRYYQHFIKNNSEFRSIGF